MKTVYTSERATWPVGLCVPPLEFAVLAIYQWKNYNLRLEMIGEASKLVEMDVQLEQGDELDKIMRSKPRRGGRDLD